MKTFLLIVFLCVCTFTSFGQSLKVIGMETAFFDLAAATNPRYDINGNVGALIKVQLSEKDATFESSMILGDVEFIVGEYMVYMAAGSKRLTIKYPHCLPLTIDFSAYNIPSLESKTTYVLQILVSKEDYSKFKKNRIYVEPQIQMGGFTSGGLFIGGYVNHINFEAYYLKGLTESEDIYWNDNSSVDGATPYGYIYKASRIGANVGYGLNFGKSFCITPQTGVAALLLSGSQIQKGDNDPGATKGHATSAVVGVKMSYIFSKHLGLVVTPEYSLAISKSDLFDKISGLSDKVKSFATGFNVRIGLFVTF